jgi:hypothetical protein
VCAITGTVEGQTPPASAAASAPQFALIGTVVTDTRALAYLQEPTLTGNGPVRVPLGERIGPYRLTRVLADQVELEGPAGRLTVRLGGAASGTGVRQAGAAAAAPPADPVSPAAPPKPKDPNRQDGFSALFAPRPAR